MNNQVAEYNPLIAEISKLKEKYIGLVYDVSLPDQYENAVIERKAFVKLNNQIDAVRKKIKEEPFELCKRIDAQAKEIKEPLESRIKQLDTWIDTQDEIQAVRDAELVARLDAIKAKPMQMAGQPSDDMQEAHAELMALNPQDFDVYSIRAKDTIAEALAQLEPMIAMQRKAEELAKAQAAQQAILDEKQAELDKVEREQQERANEQKRLDDLEQARLDGIVQAQRDAQLKIEQEILDKLKAEALRPDQEKLASWLQSCIDNAPSLNDEKLQSTVNAIIQNFKLKIEQLS